jgi:hypothetical protein
VNKRHQIQSRCKKLVYSFRIARIIRVPVLFRFSVKWRDERSPLVSNSAPLGRGFSRHEGLPIRWVFGEEREGEFPRPNNIVSMSPPSYLSAWVHPCSGTPDRGSGQLGKEQLVYAEIAPGVGS